MNPDVLTLLLTLVGAGGLGSVIIGVLANRKLNKAQETMTLAEGYEKRLAVLTSRIISLENRQVKLQEHINKFKGLLNDREGRIQALQRENEELKSEVEALRCEVGRRDERIVILEGKVRELTILIQGVGADKSEC
jgi:chromosome segregation ATPase